ncbi:hypothetical protein LTR37_013402 [Vermiconidia calcicola]|uniref:Uncharacterized protein n=1 Tax=Vermiconidia calcicola TaxID=1690605 RepID=A0ACC3MWI1_9PEZI|nr:hypothetical protein LTR37_013402 [Vermiconidia calcicola]
MHPQSQSPLLKLPSELRAEIYDLALTADGPILDPNVPESRWHEIPPLGLGLFRTCRLIYLEIDSQLLYQRNEFSFTAPIHAHDFLLKLSSRERICIRSLTFDLRELISDDFRPDRKFIKVWRHYIFCRQDPFNDDRPRLFQVRDQPHITKILLPHLQALTLDLRFLQTRGYIENEGGLSRGRILSEAWEAVLFPYTYPTNTRNNHLVPEVAIYLRAIDCHRRTGEVRIPYGEFTGGDNTLSDWRVRCFELGRGRLRDRRHGV